MKKVSVIVPVYNMEKYLIQCMDSLVNQTLDDIEIIFINDGSSDKSLDLIKEYKKHYSNKIKIIDQENAGISVARNNGIKIATGKYIGFVDSDDFVDLNMFEHLYSEIEKTKSDIVVCNYKKYYQSDDNYININVVKNINSTNIYEDTTLINSIDYGPCNKLYKKSLFDGIEFPVNKKYEDLNAILKIFLKANKISKINEFLYFYRINENGETLTVNKRVNDIVYILSDLIAYCKKSEKYNLLEYELRKMCLDKLFYYLILSYQLNDKQYIIDFRKCIIEFLNTNFKSWKKYFIFKSNFRFITKLILANNKLFKIYISKRFGRL